ncbi:DUF3618 domain-containing protein [Cellulomonas shaoxiangyii]|uniref:DUF3618 domain-containing protein n=1 Tax=Cellulomonas shaoxiangyii TaxID=2566013 RepID=A0A4P7SJG4_9CELL|nr:DUF3618 domain-containing protein [Cellulomonas shaoxiangyii]QCB92653.1 DUF3618 domain-containing protein [Cellulomonas shaoxiangyii]TGY85461.1 DUF3618 domain-containing protein [Cellulomonas shaoxiangyii]
MSEDEATRITTPKITELEAEVVVSRGQLASTVDALAERLDPRVQKDKLVADGKRLVFDATDAAALPEDRSRARKIFAVAGGVAALVVAGIVRKVTR